MTSYCDFVASKGQGTVHQHYHDHEYGFPLRDDNALFERLVLEINQAGLSWELILKRKPAFQRAYDNFDVATVADYDDEDRLRLKNDAGVIRNSLKINAAIDNARIIQAIQREHGSFHAWLEAHHTRSHDAWTALFRKTFRFTGPEVVREFLMSTGYLEGAHVQDCPVYAQIAALKPAWMREK